MAEPFEHFALEELVDQAAFLREDALYHPSGKIAEDDAISADAETVIASQLLPQSELGAAFSLKRPNGKFEPPPRIR